MSELADEHDLGSCAARREGSSPSSPTKFWAFINSSGPIWIESKLIDDEFVDRYQDGHFSRAPSTRQGIQSPRQSEVSGDVTDVMLQCFERRCVTYSPDNPDGWQVESGNVGLHYVIWRHHELGYGFAYYGGAFEGAFEGSDTGN
jgi:hypothetical protein